MDIKLAKKVSCDLVRSIRAERSQKVFGQLIDFPQEMVSKIESGTRRLYWGEFIKVCNRCGINLGQISRKLLRIDPEKPHALFLRLISDLSSEETIAWLQCSRSSIARWRSPGVDVPLHVVLSLLEYHGLLCSFLGQLNLLDKIPSIAMVVRQQHAASRVFVDFPEASLVLCACDLNAYKKMQRYEKGFFSSVIGVSPKKEQEILSALLSSRLLVEKDGKYIPTLYFSNLTPDDTENYRQAKRLKSYWLRRGLDAYNDDSFGQSNVVGGFEVFSVTAETRQMILREVERMRLKIHRLLEEAPSGTEELCVLQYQVFDPNPGKLGDF